MITTPPKYSGPFGSAWEVDVKKLVEEKGYKYAVDDCMLACWVIHAPNSHPIWPWYRLLLIHLRELTREVMPVKFYLDGATHEIVLHALDPEHYPPDVLSVPNRTLEPTNFAAQVISGSDENAIKLIEVQAISKIIDGQLSPDTDARSQWESLFGNNMVKGPK